VSTYCTRQEVIERFGGSEALSQCLDPNRTGTYDTATLDGAIEDASGDVDGELGTRYAEVGAVIPPKIRRLTATLAVKYCWTRGTGGKGMPVETRNEYNDAVRELQRISKTESGVGKPGSLGTKFSFGLDNSAGGSRAVYSTWRRAGQNGAR